MAPCGCETRIGGDICRGQEPSLVVWKIQDRRDHEEVLRKMSSGKEAESKFPDRFLLEVGLNSS